LAIAPELHGRECDWLGHAANQVVQASYTPTADHALAPFGFDLRNLAEPGA
jgi:hypothetical protein